MVKPIKSIPQNSAEFRWELNDAAFAIDKAVGSVNLMQTIPSRKYYQQLFKVIDNLYQISVNVFSPYMRYMYIPTKNVVDKDKVQDFERMTHVMLKLLKSPHVASTCAFTKDRKYSTVWYPCDDFNKTYDMVPCSKIPLSTLYRNFTGPLTLFCTRYSLEQALGIESISKFKDTAQIGNIRKCLKTHDKYFTISNERVSLSKIIRVANRMVTVLLNPKKYSKGLSKIQGAKD